MSSVPWFKSTLMNMVLRDLSGWRCEKLTEHSAVLHLNAFYPGYLPCSAKTVIHGQYSQL
ncbi:cytoplasmic protein [Salmonella sp. NCTC 11881]|nr:cytoplasmic protein [Salmonella sp. NCTC 11881]